MRYKLFHQIVIRETAFVVLFSVGILLLTIISSCGYGNRASMPLPAPATIGADSLQQAVRYYVTYEISF